MLLFKYLSPEGAAKTLEDEACLHLRFAYPNTYNDPYELFLETDPPLDDCAERAFYDVLVGTIPQLPTTCFSHVPDSVTMWAHYCREHTGACLVIDEDALVECLEITYVEDVEYSDNPAQISAGGLSFALATGKNRHAVAVRAQAHRAAYFAKRLEWRYEQERRCIVDSRSVEDRGGHLIADIDCSTLRGLIIGARADDALHGLCEVRATEAGIPLMVFRNGRRSYQPFFTRTHNDQVLVWGDGEFVETPSCKECGEPGVLDDDGECHWCSITEGERNEAMTSNAMFLFESLGVTEPTVEFPDLRPRGRAASDNPPPSRAKIVEPRPPRT